MKVAALDLGTNTFLCLVAEAANGEVGEIYSDQVEMVRLGQGVSVTRRFQPEALERADHALGRFAETIREFQPERVLAMATSAARDVENSEALFRICNAHNIPLRIIGGSEEARLTFEGALSGFSSVDGNSKLQRLVVDVGGGSTEFVLGRGREMVWAKSLNIGCVRMKERWISKFPVGELVLQGLRESIGQEIQKETAQWTPSTDSVVNQLIGVAGTPTELARIDLGDMEFDRDHVDHHVLTRSRLQEWAERFSSRTPEEIVQQWNVSPGRADVLLIGVLILLETMDRFKKEEMEVSIRGLRYGIATEVAR